MTKHIPNLLTMLRFVLIPFIVWYLSIGNYILAFMFLTISGLTDVLDGFIARKFNFITNFGKLIDPLADKATQVSVLSVLAFQNVIPSWILIIVLLKECIMRCGNRVIEMNSKEESKKIIKSFFSVKNNL